MGRYHQVQRELLWAQSELLSDDLTKKAIKLDLNQKTFPVSNFHLFWETLSVKQCYQRTLFRELAKPLTMPPMNKTLSKLGRFWPPNLYDGFDDAFNLISKKSTVMELNTMKLIDWPLLFLLFGARDFNRTGNTKGSHFRPDYIDMFLIPRLSHSGKICSNCQRKFNNQLSK